MHAQSRRTSKRKQPSDSQCEDFRRSVVLLADPFIDLDQAHNITDKMFGKAVASIGTNYVKLFCNSPWSVGQSGAQEVEALAAHKACPEDIQARLTLAALRIRKSHVSL